MPRVFNIAFWFVKVVIEVFSRKGWSQISELRRRCWREDAL